MRSLTYLRRARISVLVLVGIAACALPATAAIGSVKVKTGAYVQAPACKKPWGYVYTRGGKVTGATLYSKMTDKTRKSCVPASLHADTNGLAAVSLKTRGSAAKVKSSGKFSFAAKGVGFTGLNGNVTGRFTSPNKAAFKSSINIRGCRSPKLNFKKAIYSAGG